MHVKKDQSTCVLRIPENTRNSCKGANVYQPQNGRLLGNPGFSFSNFGRFGAVAFATGRFYELCTRALWSTRCSNGS